MHEGSITSPRGFRAAGVACGLKAEGRPDLALIVCDRPAAAAGVYTTNVIKGHSLQLTLERIATRHQASALLINSGNANACIGQRGAQAARDIAAHLALQLGLPEQDVLVGSTGVIGIPLNTGKVCAGIDQAVAQLSNTVEAGHVANRAMLTTDTVSKEVSVDFPMGYDTVTIAGMAKGSGMIHPNLATMIGVITTDARITPECLQQVLSDVVYSTFNRVTVDGDTSCCDMVIVLASGLADHPMITKLDSPEGRLFRNNLEFVATGLSRMIAADGEGATKLVDVRVCGAPNEADAYRAALAVAKSPLVKTAIFGEDANWGRILTAVGYSGACFDPARVDISIGHVQVCRGGTAAPFDEDEAKRVLKRRDIILTIDMNQGYCEDHFWTCDFTDGYIRINADYRS